jgi:hypothetical protein
VAKWDYEILMPLLLIIYNKLTWAFFNVQPLDVVLLELGVFGYLTSSKPKGSCHGMFRIKFCFIDKFMCQV